MQAKLEEAGVTVPATMQPGGNTEAVLQRYLKARKLDVDAAFKQLQGERTDAPPPPRDTRTVPVSDLGPSDLWKPTASWPHATQPVLCKGPIFTRPLLGSSINLADCLIAAPISSQSTGPSGPPPSV